MVKVVSRQYDDDAKQGNVTQMTRHIGSSGSDRVTSFSYDWRNRRTQIDKPSVDDPSDTTYHKRQEISYDNLSRRTQVDRYKVLSGTATLIGRRKMRYDDRNATRSTNASGSRSMTATATSATAC
jgi:hypothetical protein